MFRMFCKKTVPAKPSPKIDKAASTIAKAIIQVQTRIACWLSKQEETLTIKQKKFALLVFFVSTVIVTGSLLYRGLFVNNNHSPNWLEIPALTIPKTYPMPDSLNLNLPSQSEKEKLSDKKNDSIHP